VLGQAATPPSSCRVGFLSLSRVCTCNLGHCAYTCLTRAASKKLYEFGELPWKQDCAEEQPAAQDVLSYIQRYAEQYNLNRLIRYNRSTLDPVNDWNLQPIILNMPYCARCFVIVSMQARSCPELQLHHHSVSPRARTTPPVSPFPAHRFNSRLRSASLNAANQWVITYVNRQGGCLEVLTADYLVVCTGLHGQPSMPTYKVRSLHV
jgi:hypothetical protein